MARKHIINQDGTPNWDTIAGFKERLDGHDVSLADIVTIKPNGTDDTTAIQSVLDSGKVVRLISGTYNISKVTLNDNAKIISSGYATIMKQIAGQPTSTPIILIQGSNIHLDAMNYIGNIATDTGEWQHAVQINNSNKIIKNIFVKGISAQNVRGDALSIAGTLANYPININVGTVECTNTYRHGVAIIAGKNITIDNIYSLNNGMDGLDIEPNTAKIENVKIGNIITGSVQLLGLYNQLLENVQIGNMRLIRSNGGSTPNYLFTGQDALQFRNCKAIRIDNLYISGFDRWAISAVVSGNDISPDDIIIGLLEMDNCSLTDTTYASYVNMGNFIKLTILSGGAILQDTSKTAFKGPDQADNEYYQLFIDNFKVTGGTFASWCKIQANKIETSGGGFSRLKPFSKIMNSVINTTSVLGYSTGVTFENCKITYNATTGYVTDSGDQKNSFINCSINGNNPFLGYGSVMPTGGSWNAGDTVLNFDSTERGTTGSKYIIYGWRRITTGSGNVLNTDWLEMHVLTGR